MEISSALTAYAKDNNAVPSDKTCHDVERVSTDEGGNNNETSQLFYLKKDVNNVNCSTNE